MLHLCRKPLVRQFGIARAVYRGLTARGAQHWACRAEMLPRSCSTASYTTCSVS